MSYEESRLLYNRLKSLAVGTPVKGHIIEHLFIGPTDWEQMCDFMNLRIKKGDEAAQIEFSHRGISLSVYGISIVKADDDITRWEMAKLDDWELMMSN